MAQSAPFTLQTSEHVLTVTTESAGIQTVARLFRDGEEVAAHSGMDPNVTLRAGELSVVVKVGPFGGIRQALLLPPGADPQDAQRLGTEFTAPPGTLLARTQDWGNRHPDLYAARHVLIAIGQTILGIVGFSAIVFGLLPSLPWPDISLNVALPQVSMPAVPWPEFTLPAIPLPDIALPRVTVPGWLEPLVGVLQYLSPIVVAVVIAVREARHRRQCRSRAETTRITRISAPQSR